MSRWTYIKAVIPIDIGCMQVEFGNKEHMDRARAKLESLFEDKITGAERNAVVFYNFEPFSCSSTYNADGSWTYYCERCYVTIVGDLRTRERDEVIAQFRKLVQDINEDKEVYIEEWDAVGAIWETDADRFDIYPLLLEMCNDKN